MRSGLHSTRLSYLVITAGCLVLAGCPDDPPPTTPTGPDVVGFTDLVDNDVALPDAGPDGSGPDGSGPDATSDTPSPDTSGDTPVTTQPCSVDFDCQNVEIPECFEAYCDSQANQCMLRARSDQPSCDDGDACTSEDKCVAGTCQGTALSCSDDNPCTQDSCDSAQGCVFAPVEGGCNDGDLCTTADRCVDGECVGDANPLCQCDVDNDCAQFDDGNACNGTLICTVKQCLVDETTVVECAPSTDPCKVNSCNPATGACEATPVEDGTSCNDNDACTQNDSCQAGECTGAPTACDDGNACTDDGCNSATGCVYSNNTNACDDGDLCTSGDACSGGACVGTPDPACNCATDADCTAFEDGDLCNGTLICDNGVCLPDPATVVTCDPTGNACTSNICEPTTGQCSIQPALEGSACDDGDACTQNDTCMSGTCMGQIVPCDDANPCTDDSCDTATGCVNTDNTAGCDDGDPCTLNDACAAGACAGTPDPACSCTTDSDCTDDGDLCNGTPSCVDSQCVINPATVVECSTDNPCQTATCVPQTGACVIDDVVNGTDCDDASACTENDVCVDGTCGGTDVNCDDSNPCTNDTCNPATGCTSTFNSAPCDDGNDCTTGDICSQGACSGTPSAECVCTSDAECETFEDGDTCNGTLICVANKCVVDPQTVVTCDPSQDNECRTNTCNPADGTCSLVNAQDGKPCSDANACTENDSCSGGTCLGVGTVTCDDGNACTDDSCDTQVGCVFADNTAACDDGDPCTDGDACEAGVCQPGQNTCPGACEPSWTLTCGSSDTWNTGSFGSTDTIDSYPCNSFSYPASEYTYTFTAPYDGEFTVALSDEGAITDLMVLKSDGDGCDPLDCVDYGFATVTQQMLQGEVWHFVVDGWNSEDETGAYTIGVNCTPTVETECTGGVDDDGDGAIDCLDTDCADDPACAVPSCAPAIPIGCGASDTSNTSATGFTDAEDDYSCNSFGYAGPEYTYSFNTPVATDVTVSLSNESASTDVMVIEDTGAGCDSDQCIGYTLGAGTTFSATPGTTYFFVVDGFNGADGSFTINVACSDNSAETNCSDSQDNDNDGATDCADTDCLGVGSCPACNVDGDCGASQVCVAGACADTCTTTCTSGTCSGGICSDTCTFDFECPEQQDCFDGLCSAGCTADADCPGDQLCGAGGVCVGGCTDTADCPTGYQCLGLTCTPECSSAADCETGHSCVGGVCAENCTDTADCLDGLLCDNSVCTLPCTSGTDCPSGWTCNTNCQPPTTTEVCDNGTDDDGDGLADCEDGDCLAAGSCPSCGQVADFFLSCNDSDTWTTVNATAEIDNYACLPWGTSGKEYTYRFDAPADGSVTVDLSGLATGVDLDLIVLQEQDGYCNPESCVAYGDSSATFDAVGGVRYFVVVDGFLGDEGDFTVSLTCN